MTPNPCALCGAHNGTTHICRPDLSDEEVDAICGGLTQNAAKCRYLRETLKLPVGRRPNGRPLVLRADLGARGLQAPSGPKWKKAA